VFTLLAVSVAISSAQHSQTNAFGDASFRQARAGEQGFFDTVKKIGSKVVNVVENIIRPAPPPQLIAYSPPREEERPERPAIVLQPKPVRPETPQISIPERSSRVEGKCTERDAGCVGAILRSKEAKAGDDPLEVQLFTELKDIKASLDAHTRGISNEENWIGNVQEIMKTYADKIKLVRNHIQDEHKVIKELNKKKHQLRTLIKQRRIEAKIKAATDSLKVIQEEIDQVESKKKEFDQNKNSLSTEITQLQQDLKHMGGGSSGGSTGVAGSSTGAATGTAAAGTAAAGAAATSASSSAAGASSSSAAAAPAATPAAAPAAATAAATY